MQAGMGVLATACVMIGIFPSVVLRSLGTRCCLAASGNITLRRAALDRAVRSGVGRQHCRIQASEKTDNDLGLRTTRPQRADAVHLHRILQAAANCSRLQPASLGTRFWRGIAVPGGVTRDVSSAETGEFGTIVTAAARDFAQMARLILHTSSVQNRFESTGILTAEIAKQLAVVGPVARASGVRRDVRRDHPSGRYRDINVEVPQYKYGDVLARARIRMDATAISMGLINETLKELPAGSVFAPVPLSGTAEGLSAVESPRGELLYWVRIRDGKITRCHIKSPSFQNWPALPLAMPGNIIADFPPDQQELQSLVLRM
jgi:Ni,Fe-hydrogenase III large subunit